MQWLSWGTGSGFLLFKVYTKSKAVHFAVLHRLAGDHVSHVKLCAKCTGFWMLFLTRLLMSLVNSMSCIFAQICVYSMYIFLLKYNCFWCVVCRDELLKFGLSASCKSFMSNNNYDSKWSTTQSFLTSKCRTSNNFLKRNLKAFKYCKLSLLKAGNKRKVKQTTLDTAGNWQMFLRKNKKGHLKKQLKDSHFFTTLVIKWGFRNSHKREQGIS